MSAEIPDLDSASDWSCTTQIWVTSFQYEIFALVPDASFGGETSCGVAKCRLFSQATEVIRMVTRWDFVRTRKMLRPKQTTHLGLAEI